MRVDLRLLPYGQVFPGVGLELSVFHAPVKELQHVLPEPSLGMRCKDPVRLYLLRELHQFAKPCLLFFPVLADIGRELPDQG